MAMNYLKRIVLAGVGVTAPAKPPRLGAVPLPSASGLSEARRAVPFDAGPVQPDAGLPVAAGAQQRAADRTPQATGAMDAPAQNAEPAIKAPKAEPLAPPYAAERATPKPESKTEVRQAGTSRSKTAEGPAGLPVDVIRAPKGLRSATPAIPTTLRSSDPPGAALRSPAATQAVVAASPGESAPLAQPESGQGDAPTSSTRPPVVAPTAVIAPTVEASERYSETTDRLVPQEALKGTRNEEIAAESSPVRASRTSPAPSGGEAPPPTFTPLPASPPLMPTSGSPPSKSESRISIGRVEVQVNNRQPRPPPAAKGTSTAQTLGPSLLERRYLRRFALRP